MIDDHDGIFDIIKKLRIVVVVVNLMHFLNTMVLNYKRYYNLHQQVRFQVSVFFWRHHS